MENSMEKNKVKEQLRDEINKWQTKIDEAKLQLHLGAKEAQGKMELYINEMELKVAQAKKKWEEIDDASENAWEDIKEGFQASFKSMSEAFAKAKEHYKK